MLAWNQTGVDKPDGVSGLAVVEDRGLEHDTVEIDAVLVQPPRHHAGPRRAVGLAEQEFRRVPAVVKAEVSLDEVRNRARVGIDTPEVALDVRRHCGRVAGANGVDEDEVERSRSVSGLSSIV